MKVGDLVKVLDKAMGSKIQLGVITDRTIGDNTRGQYTIFEVMTSDGKVSMYTSDALRVENESR